LGAWGLPAAAAAFWAGLLAWDLFAWPKVAPWWGWLAVGLGCLALAVGRLPRTEQPGDPLAAAGVTPPEPQAVAAVRGRSRGPGRAVVGALAALLVGLVTLGVGWGGLAAVRRDGSYLARHAPVAVELIGTLREDPRPGAVGWHAYLDVTEATIDGHRVRLRETVWLGGDDTPPPAVRGDQVRVNGGLEHPDDPGFAESLAHHGVSVAVRANDLERLGPSPNPFVRLTQVIRSFVGRTIQRIFGPKEAGLLLGLVLGDDSQLDAATARDFHATGLGHLLVVSGENVAMVLAPVLALAAAIGLARVGRSLLGFGTVAVFVVLTGAEPSVLRAGVMATLALLGILLGRPRDTGVVLSGAVLLLLVVDPWLVHAIGFQLSVGATAGMVALASPLSERLGRLAPRPLAMAAGTTLAAQLGVTPLLLFHFHDVPLITLVANVGAFPAVSPALLLGIAASALGLVWIPLGQAVALLATAPMRYLQWLADVLAKAPVAHLTSRGGPAILVVGTALAIGAAVALRRRWRPSRRVTAWVLAVLPILVWTTAVAKGPPAALTVHFFDVGQGDAALVLSPGGASMLVDGGPDDEQVATELARLGVKRLDVLVASHPHADHIVGLPAVLARVPVGLVLQPGCEDSSPQQRELDAAIRDEDLAVRHPRAGETLWVGDLRVDVLSPDRCWEGTDSDANNDALVLRISIGGDVVLIASECEEPAQTWLLETDEDLRADVFKVPHHGAATSVPAFFEAVAPPVSIVSVGENGYGHPTAFTLDALARAGTEVWRTDQHGTITVTFQGGVPIVDAAR
jgi:competence protein ComEC